MLVFFSAVLIENTTPLLAYASRSSTSTIGSQGIQGLLDMLQHTSSMQMQAVRMPDRDYVGPEHLIAALESGTARPLSVAGGDITGDGIPDLIIGYTTADAAFVTLQAGDGQCLVAHCDAPFSPITNIIPLPTPPEFLGVGDFDGDGKNDIVGATSGEAAFFLLPGDGQGGMGMARSRELPGQVTAFTTSEVNRLDGLPEIMVGVTQPHESSVLVFEAAEGAFVAQPQTIAVPDIATNMVTGQFDQNYPFDLAIAVGHEVMLVYGQDHARLHTMNAQAQLPVIQRLSTQQEVVSLAAGFFTDLSQPSLALLGVDGMIRLMSMEGKLLSEIAVTQEDGDASASMMRIGKVRISGTATDDVLVVRGTSLSLIVGGEIVQHIPLSNRAGEGENWGSNGEPYNGDALAVLPMRLNQDMRNDLVVVGAGELQTILSQSAQVFTVNTILDSDDGSCTPEHCSFREAINATNASVGTSTIAFNIPLTATLEMTSTHLLRGYDLTRFSRPKVAQTIFLESLLPPIVRPVVIDGTTQPGFAGEPIIELNGDNIRQTFVRPGQQVILDGLVIQGGNSTIQGLVINRFQGNGIVLRSGNNLIQGNYIGTELECVNQRGVGNAWNGILIENASDNTIGGTQPAARNIISGNFRHGLLISGASASRNTVQGNFIGLNKYGTSVDIERNPAIGNSMNGILIESGSNNRIGGAESGAGNIISSNTSSGISIINNEATGNIIQGNTIGTDTTGTMRLGNTAIGISISNAPYNTIGGTVPTARNVIVNNGGTGVSVGGSLVTGTLIQGNFIGLNPSGTDVRGNSGWGINISESSENVIGGTTGSSRNIISGNSSGGIRIQGSNAISNSILGNFIGTDITGMIGLGNQGSGIVISFSPRNIIGGVTPEARNVISANQAHGIFIDGSSGSNNRIRGNYIGTTSNGDGDLGNAQDGILIVRARNNAIGGSEPGAQNIIANNRRNGINLQGSTAEGNLVQGNAIGTDSSGMARMGNANHGIILIGTAENLIGGDQDSEGNIIANNYLGGILVSSSIAQIRKNTIRDHGNGAAVAVQRVEAVVAGNTIENNPLVFRLGSGKLNAYANNITNFVNTLAREGGTFNGQHNWWGRSSGPAPQGLEIALWSKRLHAPVEQWASGLGSATLGDASITGGSGQAVIVSHAHEAFDHPYEHDDDNLSKYACSPFYEFFIVEGSGTWTIQIPFDDTPECSSVRERQQVSWYTEPNECLDIRERTCWSLISPEMIVAASEQHLVVSGVDSEKLANSIIVAGDLTVHFPIWIIVVITIVLILLIVAGVVGLRWFHSRREA